MAVLIATYKLGDGAAKKENSPWPLANYDLFLNFVTPYWIDFSPFVSQSGEQFFFSSFPTVIHARHPSLKHAAFFSLFLQLLSLRLSLYLVPPQMLALVHLNAGLHSRIHKARYGENSQFQG